MLLLFCMKWIWPGKCKRERKFCARKHTIHSVQQHKPGKFLFFYFVRYPCRIVVVRFVVWCVYSRSLSRNDREKNTHNPNCSSCADYRMKYVCYRHRINSSFITVIFGTTNYGQSLTFANTRAQLIVVVVVVIVVAKPDSHPDIKEIHIHCIKW